MGEGGAALSPAPNSKKKKLEKKNKKTKTKRRHSTRIRSREGVSEKPGLIDDNGLTRWQLVLRIVGIDDPRGRKCRRRGRRTVNVRAQQRKVGVVPLGVQNPRRGPGHRRVQPRKALCRKIIDM
jgi:hypothetical protein